MQAINWLEGYLDSGPQGRLSNNDCRPWDLLRTNAGETWREHLKIIMPPRLHDITAEGLCRVWI